MNVLRFITIMLTALSLSAAFAHLLEMPAKLTYDGALWLNLLQTLYPTFGTISGTCEIAAVIASWVLVAVVRSHPKSFRWTVLAAALLTATHAVFWIWVAPVNAALVPLSAETLPADWAQLRDQWEYAHAARAILQVFALAGLVISLLVEIPPAAGRAAPARL